jgi:hypothetical protein
MSKTPNYLRLMPKSGTVKGGLAVPPVKLGTAPATGAVFHALAENPGAPEDSKGSKVVFVKQPA